MPAAEVLAASEENDKADVLSYTYSEILHVDVGMHLLIDIGDFFNSLSTQNNSVDRSSREEVASKRLEYQTGHVNDILWIPGNTNLADLLTKMDSALTGSLLLTMYDGGFYFSFEDHFEAKTF